MNTRHHLILFAAGILLASLGSTLAATHYVDVNSTNATPPYTNWIIAATNIQDAVDAAVAGDEIVVTSGIYSTGGRETSDRTNGLSTINRVKVDKPLSVRSVNGPQFTTIEAPGGLDTRCVYLTNSASLSGFALTNGRAEGPGGGVFCESQTAVVSNCTMTGNNGGGAYGGTLNNCTFSGNAGSGAANCTLNNCMLSGNWGSGSAYCTLNNCTLSGNTGAIDRCLGTSFCSYGGGAYHSTLNNCTLTDNYADYGGGAYSSTLNNCRLSGNSGSGAAYCTLYNCTLTGNSANYGGGGAEWCTLHNCTLTGNSANYGGGAENSTLYNCTLAGNSGGGAFGCTLTNCVVYFNAGTNYDSSCTLNYCCATPLPTNGVGNISCDPELASASHLSAFSPCIGKGYYPAASGADIDGEPWANPPSIGCDEYHPGAVTGPLSIAITSSFTNVALGYPLQFTAVIEGRTDLSAWTFGDGTLEVNQPYTTHS